MAEDKKKESTDSVAKSGASRKLTASTAPKPQTLRVSTIIRNNDIDSLTAAAVMTANRLKPTSRIEPDKFLKMVEQFKNRKIKTSGRR